MAFDLGDIQELGFVERLEAPDFGDGASAREAARFFEVIGRSDLAESVRICAYNTADKAVFILADSRIGGYKRHGENGKAYFNIAHLGSSFLEREVPGHEHIHNEHEDNWGKISIPGWSDLSTIRRRAILRYAGIDESFSETEAIEALTQYATQVKIGETESGYDRYVVPTGVRLFRTLEALSGKSMIGGFLNMALRGSKGGKQEFADGMRIGANAILIESVLKRRQVYRPGDTLQDMIQNIEEQRKDFVVQDPVHAERLVDSYLKAKSAGVVGTSRKVGAKITHILPLAA